MTASAGRGRFLRAIDGRIEEEYVVDDTMVYEVNENQWYSLFHTGSVCKMGTCMGLANTQTLLEAL